mmetsp:Transcript_16450/g.14138  ORF Transcript_16450/g.14138 Transcript_16450/m.14138 type:complete len:129 (-) Transcript_16450:172-558(-)
MFTYPNKDIYSGWWKYGKKHGKGTYVFFDTKMRLVGEWSEGNMVNGKWIFPNGVEYHGDFKKNKPNGQGTWKFKNGNSLTGTYTQHEADPEEEIDDTGAPIKPKIKCEWNSETNLGSSAYLVNEHLTK